MAIARFIASRFNLAGSNDLNQAKANAIVDTCLDLMNAYVDHVLHNKEFADVEKRNEVKKKFIDDHAHLHLAKIEKLIGFYGSNGFSAESALTWADLAVHDITTIILEMQSNSLDKYPFILAVRKSVEANSRVADYLKNRPTSEF